MSGEKLRILYVLPYVPSPIRVRPFQIIRYLARLGHRITVVALEEGFTPAEALDELKGVCEAVYIVPHKRVPAALNCLLALPTSTPLWAAYCQSAPMARLLQQLTRESNFHIAHVEHLRAAHFARNLGSLPRIIDAVDCITALRRQILDQGVRGAARLFNWEEWSKLRSYEPAVYRAFRRIAVTSAHDATELATLAPERLPPVEIIPNGVDLEYFTPAGEPVADGGGLVFSGKMSYIANEDAARFLLLEVMPRLRRLRPGVTLTLAGSKPSASLVALAEKTGGVTVTGFVEDLRPFLQRAAVAICPMRIGVGIQNKALEAMAMGKPVVASPLAARSLADALSEGGVTIADSAEGFAAACAGLLAQPERAAEAGRAARAYVEARHRWEVVAERFTNLYHTARVEASDSNRSSSWKPGH